MMEKNIQKILKHIESDLLHKIEITPKVHASFLKKILIYADKLSGSVIRKR